MTGYVDTTIHAYLDFVMSDSIQYIRRSRSKFVNIRITHITCKTYIWMSAGNYFYINMVMHRHVYAFTRSYSSTQWNTVDNEMSFCIR